MESLASKWAEGNGVLTSLDSFYIPNIIYLEFMSDEDVLSLEDNITNIAVALLWFFGCALMVVEPLRT